MSRGPLFAFVLLLTQSVTAADWFAAVDGKEASAGSKDSPWDITSSLNGGQRKIAPGDSLWLRAGTYKKPWRKGQQSHGFEVRLAGSADKPILIRAQPGQRVTIDGGLSLGESAKYLWLWDLEIMASEPRPEKALGPANTAQALPPESDISQYKPWSGLNVSTGSGYKFINLIIHDNCQGVSWWNKSDGELYGCIIYDNGWLATDRGHGHCCYTQNKDGIKLISNCIMSCLFDGTYTLHAYGSERADVDNYVIENNIAYDTGKFLIGGGKPSHNITAKGNLLYKQSLRLGYNAPENENCEVRDNYIVNGTLEIKNFKQAINEGNTIIKSGEKRPAEPKVFFLPNKYDPNRAHVVVFNFTRAAQVPVKMDKFLKAGESVRLLNPKDFYGKPVWQGSANAAGLMVPTPQEFNVYVVMKGGVSGKK